MECSECGEPVPEDAEQCPDCGASLQDVAAAESAAGPSGEATATASDDDAAPPDDGDAAASSDATATASGEAGAGAPDDEVDPLVQDASVEDGLLGGSGGASHEPTATVPASQVYEDDGVRYVERSMLPDRRLRETEDGTAYLEPGTATRAVAGAVAAVCVIGGLYFAFLFEPGSTPVAALGGPFGLLESVPRGNLLLAFLLLVVGAKAAQIAQSGREYVEVGK